MDRRDHFFEVNEYGHRFRVNLFDYLDTGLFPDHRLTRRLIGELADQRSFLNLFAYTGAATVYAAAGGARTTLTIDMSRTYLDMARANMELNGFRDKSHRFLREDCLAWLGSNPRERFDLIFLDPPTFSNSKRMRDVLDIQRDHVTLIRQCITLLTPGGILIFSNNRRNFKLDHAALEGGISIEDITQKTIPEDYARNSQIHCCFMMRKT